MSTGEVAHGRQKAGLRIPMRGYETGIATATDTGSTRYESP